MKINIFNINRPKTLLISNFGHVLITFVTTSQVKQCCTSGELDNSQKEKIKSWSYLCAQSAITKMHEQLCHLNLIIQNQIISAHNNNLNIAQKNKVR